MPISNRRIHFSFFLQRFCFIPFPFSSFFHCFRSRINIVSRNICGSSEVATVEKCKTNWKWLRERKCSQRNEKRGKKKIPNIYLDIVLNVQYWTGYSASCCISISFYTSNTIFFFYFFLVSSSSSSSSSSFYWIWFIRFDRCEHPFALTCGWF